MSREELSYNVLYLSVIWFLFWFNLYGIQTGNVGPMILTHFEVSALYFCFKNISFSILGEVETTKQISMLSPPSFQHEGDPSGTLLRQRAQK